MKGIAMKIFNFNQAKLLAYKDIMLPLNLWKTSV